MRKNIGFSSGAVACGNFRLALSLLGNDEFSCIELSALRVSELRPLIQAIPQLDLTPYSYVSLHAPSSFSETEEVEIADVLFSSVPNNWPIVLHPDAIFDYSLWRKFGPRLAIENMDKRKPIGRTADELVSIFDKLPDALFCFDVGHARQCDASMTEAFRILSRFSRRLAQVHISEVNTFSQHDSISHGAKLAFQQIANMIPENIPIIVESRVATSQISNEARLAIEALETQHKSPNGKLSTLLDKHLLQTTH